MILMLSMYLSLFNAHAAPSLERLCFNSSSEAQRAIPILNVILIKGQDAIDPEGKCLNVSVDSSRIEVFQRWVKTRLPEAYYHFSAASAPVEMCDIVVTKQSQKNQQDQNINVNTKGFGAVITEGNNSGKEESFIKVSSGKSAELRVDQDDLTLTCVKKNNSRYLITVALRFIPPTPPQAPPGSIIVMQAPPPDQSGTSISTEIEVSVGQDVNIGQVVKDLKSKQTQVNLPESAELSQKSGIDQTQWFLRIKN
ncbi:MAG: hypothetical protein K2P81_01835 [Bacteriovoracaceae bacterium]|nr:hypothetical protein [Bacteriovoracaceae bacterium]